MEDKDNAASSKVRRVPPTTTTRFLRIGSSHLLMVHVHVASQHASWFHDNSVFDSLCVPILATRLRARIRASHSVSSIARPQESNSKTANQQSTGAGRPENGDSEGMPSAASPADVYRDPRRGFQMAFYFRRSRTRRTAVASVAQGGFEPYVQTMDKGDGPETVQRFPYHKFVVVPRTLEVVVEPYNPLAPKGSKLARQTVPDFLNVNYKHSSTIDHYFIAQETQSNQVKE